MAETNDIGPFKQSIKKGLKRGLSNYIQIINYFLPASAAACINARVVFTETIAFS